MFNSRDPPQVEKIQVDGSMGHSTCCMLGSSGEYFSDLYKNGSAIRQVVGTDHTYSSVYRRAPIYPSACCCYQNPEDDRWVLLTRNCWGCCPIPSVNINLSRGLGVMLLLFIVGYGLLQQAHNRTHGN